MPILSKNAPKATKTTKTTKTNETTQAHQAHQATDNSSTDDESEEVDAEVQPGQELGTVEAQGGGAEVAVLTDTAADTSNDTNGASYTIEEDDDGNMNTITFFSPLRPPIVYNCPAPDSPEGLVWALLASHRRVSKRKREGEESAMKVALNKLYAIVAPLVSGQGTEGANSAVGSSDLVSFAHGRGFITPTPIVFEKKYLPAHAQKRIEGVYWLAIDEYPNDVHGRAYTPALYPDPVTGKPLWRGSKLGGTFPHAIIMVKEPGTHIDSQRFPMYICAASNQMHFTVRLNNLNEVFPGDGNSVSASETDIIGIINDAYTQPQRAVFDYLDNRMDMYMFLAFDNDNTDTPVCVDAFNHTPDMGKILDPCQSLPSNLNHSSSSSRTVSFYEFEMKNGRASITFRFGDNVSSNNLKEEHRNRKFCFVVKALNPHLVHMRGMTVKSQPFMIKSVLHNDVKSNERYVKDSTGKTIESPTTDRPHQND